MNTDASRPREVYETRRESRAPRHAKPMGRDARASRLEDLITNAKLQSVRAPSSRGTLSAAHVWQLLAGWETMCDCESQLELASGKTRGADCFLLTRARSRFWGSWLTGNHSIDLRHPVDERRTRLLSRIVNCVVILVVDNWVSRFTIATVSRSETEVTETRSTFAKVMRWEDAIRESARGARTCFCMHSFGTR